MSLYIPPESFGNLSPGTQRFLRIMCLVVLIGMLAACIWGALTGR